MQKFLNGKIKKGKTTKSMFISKDIKRILTTTLAVSIISVTFNSVAFDSIVYAQEKTAEEIAAKVDELRKVQAEENSELNELERKRIEQAKQDLSGKEQVPDATRAQIKSEITKLKTNNQETNSEDSKLPPKKDANSNSSAEINVKNADIAAILRIFSRKTGRNYILDERVKGKVTMYLPGTIPPSESLKILDSVLALKGFTAVPIGDNIWKVIPSKEAKQSTIPTVRDTEDLPGAAVVTRLINLKYVSAEEIQQLVSQIVSPDGFVNGYPGTNSLVVIDYEDNIARIMGLVEDLDLPFKNREMAIIPVKNAEATDIADKLKELLGDGSKKDSGNPETRFQNLLNAQTSAISAANAASKAASQGGAPVSASLNTGGNTGGAPKSRSTEPKITADERTNSIIVIGDEDSINRIKALVSQLDTQLDLSGNRFYVYRCQHANAEELADVLSGLVGQGGGGGGSRNNNRNRGNSFGVSNSNGSGDDGNIFGGGLSGRGLQGRNSRGSRTQDRLSGSSRRPGTSRNEGNQSSGGTTVELGENFSITADPATNSLVIQASKTDYEKVKELLRQLDIKRRQVLVEAALLEVSIGDESALSVDLFGSGGGDDGGVFANTNFTGNLAKVLSNPSSLQNFTLAAASAGSLKIGGDNGITIPTQSVVINAAKNNSNINVLSSPTLLATDNEEAEIVVGRNIPFVTGSSSNLANLDNNNNVFNQIDRQDVGITLRLTPQISSQDYVTLKIFTDVSDVLPGGDARLGPTTSVRSSETTIITKDGQMIVIGGLIEDGTKDSQNGVPFLQDVPVIGQAFRSTTSEKTRKNLLTFITPRIIKDQFDARDSTIDYRDAAKDIIEITKSEPKREDLLDSVEIDRVAEVDDTQIAKPGTMLPPKDLDKSQDRDSNNNEKESYNKKSVSDSTENDVIELNIEAEPQNENNFQKLKEPGKQNLSKSEVNTQIADTRYIVLKPAFPDMVNELSQSLPFVSSKKGFVGLVMPEQDSPAINDFFRVGDTYSYQIGDTKIPFKVVEVHHTVMPSSKTTALNKEEWYTLTPYELLSLGQGPWEKK